MDEALNPEEISCGEWQRSKRQICWVKKGLAPNIRSRGDAAVHTTRGSSGVSCVLPNDRWRYLLKVLLCPFHSKSIQRKSYAHSLCVLSRMLCVIFGLPQDTSSDGEAQQIYFQALKGVDIWTAAPYLLFGGITGNHGFHLLPYRSLWMCCGYVFLILCKH